MTEPDSIILAYLRKIDAKLDLVIADVRDLKIRMTAVEESIAGVQRRIDRVEGRLERIERRLELTEA